MRHHLRFELAPGRSGLARLLSRVHAGGLEVEHVHVDGFSGCIAVQGEVSAARVTAVLDRLVEVVSVRVDDLGVPAERAAGSTSVGQESANFVSSRKTSCGLGH